jgi:hypothetical protein
MKTKKRLAMLLACVTVVMSMAVTPAYAHHHHCPGGKVGPPGKHFCPPGHR